MERLVYCVHEHVDRLFALKRQRYIWCSCSFTNSTNVRQQDVARSLFLQKSPDEKYLLAFSSILINWYIAWELDKKLGKLTHFKFILIAEVLWRFSGISDCCNCYLVKFANWFISEGEVALANAPTKSLSRWLKTLVKEEHEKVDVID